MIVAPRWMFRQTVTVEPYIGEGAYGPQYGAGYMLKCRIEARVHTVLTPDGEETTAMARLFCLPGANLPTQSKVIWDGAAHDVLTVGSQPGPTGKPHHIEVSLA
jgi:hypothetical protein